MKLPIDQRLAGAVTVGLFLAFAGSARADEPTPATTTTEAPATVATAPAAPSVKHHTVVPWVLMAGGIVVLATALVFEVKAVREDDDRQNAEIKLQDYAQQGPSPQKTALEAEVDDHRSSASQDRTTAIVLGTVGFLTVAGSVVVWFLEGGSSPSASPTTPTTPPSAKRRPTLLPSFAPGYAGATLGATF